MADNLTVEALMRFAEEWSSKSMSDLNSFQISAVQLRNIIKEMDSKIANNDSLEDKLGIDNKIGIICDGGCF